VMEFYSPVSTMLLRLAISSIIIFFLFRKRIEKIERKDYKAFFWLSFFSPFCYFIGESFGVFHVSPVVASVIVATIPVFTPLLGYFGFKEKLTAINFLGFAVSFSGVVVMVLDVNMRFTASPIGVAFLFLAVFSALTSMVFLKTLTKKYSSTTIIATQNLLGVFFFLPLFLVMDFPEFVHIRPSTGAIVSILALAFFASTLAFIFFTSGIRALGVARASIYTNLIPVFTAIIALLVLKEVLDAQKLIGMALVMTGLFMTQMGKKAIN
jgi:drug/metabolite transporter (DMT)-like permease